MSMPLRRMVIPRFSRGAPVEREPDYTVEIWPSGNITIERNEVDRRILQSCVISRFAWDGIVTAVSEMRRESERKADEDIALANLEPCPFCGNAPQMNMPRDRCYCQTNSCALSGLAIPLCDWNHRPIEDALRAEKDEMSR